MSEAWSTGKFVGAGVVLVLFVGGLVFYLWLVIELLQLMLDLVAWLYQIVIMTGSLGSV